MTSAPPAPPRRRIVVQDDDRRLDLAIPAVGDLGNALAAAGVRIDWRGRAVVGVSGSAVDPATPVDALRDGEVYTIVVREQAPPGGRRGRRGGRPEADDARSDAPGLWLLLGAAALVAVLLAATAGARLDGWRIALAVTFAAAALGSGIALARRGGGRTPFGAATGVRGDTAAAARLGGLLPAPLGLGFAAGVLAVPPALTGSGILALAAGAVCAALAATAIAAATPRGPLRAGASTAAALLLGSAVVPLLGLAAGWGPFDVAVVVAGLVPLVLRALPASLLDLPAAMSVDLGRHMSNRWTVRGAVPDPIDRIESAPVREAVEAAVARLSVGTSLLSLVGAVAGSAWLLGGTPFRVGDAVRLSGAIALAACLVLALLLSPRRTSDPGLRWPPRAAAGVIAVVAAIAGTTIVGGGTRPVPVVVAIVLLAAAVAMAAASVAIGRGYRSLAWSRVGDAIEWIAVALSLPAALLAVGVLDLLRGMMA